MSNPKRTVGFGGLIIAALVLSGVGGGMVGGVAGYRLAQVDQTATAVVVTPTTATPQTNANLTAQPVVANSNDAVVQTVANASPAVVKIISTVTGGQASGSGAIINEDGYIITNNHVVEGQNRLQVIYSDGTSHNAELIGTDAFSDIAVIRVLDAVPATISLGNSDELKPGETVVAIGSPLGKFQNSVTVGVVSALDRTIDRMEGLIQTDAAINHGNSGGPLINLKGEIVGINTLVVRGDIGSIDEAQGLGFAVPSNIVREVSDTLIANGQVVRPYMGISYELLSPETAELGIANDKGAFVTKVDEGTPARRAGVSRGDIILAVNGEEITQRHSLQRLLLQYKPGDTVTVTIERNGQQQEVQITLTERPS
ncbi:S1C family serine protease [Herpetosiphon sp. NSE202]|uniref:S1C family serine protease n=1 Tax=Herpetosiphon sp. NSE202 TaxID=3351349 RepID=UPI0036342612